MLLGMGSFMLFIVVLVFMMFRQPADNFDPQYYEHGLNFDSEYAKERNVITDAVQPVIKIQQGICSIDFTGEAKGKAVFSRPSDTKMDHTFALENIRQLEIPSQKLAHGKWRVVINWKLGSRQYLYKQEIYIP